MVIIGAGNVGCDVACEAYRLGAEKVTLVDIQKPLAFGKEKEAAEALGAVFRWPVMTSEVTDEGLVMNTGEVIPAQTVIISIGDVPALPFLPESVETVTVGGAAWITTDKAHVTSNARVLAVGDVEKPGLATNALGAGKTAAEFIVASIKGVDWQPFTKPLIPQQALTITHYAPDISRADRDGTGRPLPVLRLLPRLPSLRDHLSDRGDQPAENFHRAVKQARHSSPREVYEYVSDDKKCIACGFCADTCPCGIWTMNAF